ncbi:MAG: LruC domain-containing protein [Bacteroidia bacterium]|nr:LruC domain-containing protein [Bacteroidia bacterium]
MKKIMILLGGLILMQFTLTAQQLVLNGESNSQKEDMGNCWDFKGISYEEKSISGKISLATELTTGAWKDLYIKSPWVKLKSGNITLKSRITAEGDKNKYIFIAYLPLEKEEEGELVEINKYDMPSTGKDVQSISFPVPSKIANDGQPYKILISIGGDKGEAGLLIDDITIPGVYYSDPSNDCKPMSLSESAYKDDDGDDVANIEDAYPNDKFKSYDNFYPASGSYGTLMFEDLWPSTGDYDFNDLVLGYKFNTITNSKNEIIEIRYTFKLRAIGASFRNGFAFQLDNIPAEAILSVTGGEFKADYAKISGNGTESNLKYANFMVFDDAYRILPSPGGSGVNVNSDAPYAKPVEIEMVVKFMDEEGKFVKLYNLKELNARNFNPYLMINQERGKEIHLPDYEPTENANLKYLGQSQDNSNPEKGIYYKSKNNLPWGLNIIEEIPYSRDTEDFLKSYPAFGEWVESSGEKTRDWYENKGGNWNLKHQYIIK